jgi:hypothetical protein
MTTKKKFSRIYKTKTYENIQLEVGLINRESPKSIYFDIRCYIKSIDTNYKQNTRKFLKSIERTVELNLDTKLFSRRFIVVNDLPNTMETLGDGFITMSYNLFLNNPDDFNGEHYVDKIETLVEIILKNNINESELFEIKKSNRKGFKNFYNQ